MRDLDERSHLYTATRKTTALTRQTFVGKVTSLFFNMLSRLVLAFLPRSKCLLISWLQSPSAVILKSKEIVCHYFHCFPIYLPWSDGTGCHDLSMDVRAGLQRKLSAKNLMLLNCGVGEDSWAPWTARRSNQSILKAISPECSLEGLLLKLKLQYSGQLMQRTDSLEKTWRWGRLKVGEEDDRGWSGWMASPTQQTWVWARSGSWWWIGKPGVLQSMGLQRIGQHWATELNWTEPLHRQK